MIIYFIFIAFCIPFLGQIARFEIGGKGLLLLDLWTAITIFTWLFLSWKNNEPIIKKLKKYPLWNPILSLLFFFWASLLFNAFWIDSWKSIAEGVFYALRYSFLLFFSFIVFDEFFKKNKKNFLEDSVLFLIFFSGGLAILGFLQLFFYPDFAQMAEKGWDPHIGRLLSTWFDPNFMGSFFAYTIIIFIAIISMFWKKHVHCFQDIHSFFRSHPLIPYLLWVIPLLLVAIVFTYSRSALLAFIIPFLILGIFYFRIALIVGIVSVFILLPFSERAMQRVGDGVQSAFSLMNTQSMFIPDATARLRVENFQEGIDIANQHFLTGVGFNFIREYKVENIHSSGGFDSSLLTVFVTSGVFGFFAFLLLHFIACKEVLLVFFQSQHPISKGIGAGILVNMIGVFAQSFFINSLFFPFFVLYFWGIIAIYLASSKK